MVHKPLRIIAAGGTFDKRYDPIAGALAFGASHIDEVLARCRLNHTACVTELPLLDSLDMTDADRTAVLAACQAAPEAAIVIIHGTDTMPETAHLLGHAALGKTVVLTGAMVPYDLRASDALFNLGFATSAAHILPAGVYIAMGGEVFTWDNVRKDRKAGRFVVLSSDATRQTEL
jgi:L-asparaginase